MGVEPKKRDTTKILVISSKTYLYVHSGIAHYL